MVTVISENLIRQGRLERESQDRARARSSLARFQDTIPALMIMIIATTQRQFGVDAVLIEMRYFNNSDSHNEDSIKLMNPHDVRWSEMKLTVTPRDDARAGKSKAQHQIQLSTRDTRADVQKIKQYMMLHLGIGVG